MNYIRLVKISTMLALCGCASSQPIIYPNVHSQAVGSAQAQQDIGECKALAESAGASSSNSKANTMARKTVKGGGVGAATGAVGGAIAGNAGRGAAIGAASGATAGLVHSLFGDSSPSPAYRNFVTRCLKDRGYDLAGWD
jgi:hypothetical protein